MSTIVDQQWLLSYLFRLLRPQLQGVMPIQDARQIYDDWDDEEVDKLYQDLYESLQSKYSPVILLREGRVTMDKALEKMDHTLTMFEFRIIKWIILAIGQIVILCIALVLLITFK